MNKFETWNDLRKHTNRAKKAMQEKQDRLTVFEDKIEKVACLKIIPFNSPLGLMDEYKGCDFGNDFYIKTCESFISREVCQNTYCPLQKSNAEYVKAVKLYDVLKQARNKAFWNMFTRSK